MVLPWKFHCTSEQDQICVNRLGLPQDQLEIEQGDIRAKWQNSPQNKARYTKYTAMQDHIIERKC